MCACYRLVCQAKRVICFTAFMLPAFSTRPTHILTFDVTVEAKMEAVNQETEAVKDTVTVKSIDTKQQKLKQKKESGNGATRA